MMVRPHVRWMMMLATLALIAAAAGAGTVPGPSGAVLSAQQLIGAAGCDQANVEAARVAADEWAVSLTFGPCVLPAQGADAGVVAWNPLVASCWTLDAGARVCTEASADSAPPLLEIYLDLVVPAGHPFGPFRMNGYGTGVLV